VTVTCEGVREVLAAQGDDPRALHMVGCLGEAGDESLQRAAETGFAPAQAEMLMRSSGRSAFEWAEKAAVQGDRNGLFELGCCFFYGRACAKDRGKAVALIREAAELESRSAQCRYGVVAFGELEWERYHWRGRAAVKGLGNGPFCDAVARLLPLFENGGLGRVLHTVALLVRANIDVAQRRVFGRHIGA
jgi:TPR repeat protein